MSEELKDPSGMPTDQSSGLEAEVKSAIEEPSGPDAESKKQKVAYETYHKSLQQEKALRKRLSDAESKLKEVEAQKMEAQGKKDELIEFLKKENTEMKERQTKAEAERIHERVTSQVQNAALKMGCVDTDLVKSLVDVSDLDVDESANVNQDSLSLALDRLKRSKPYLFSAKQAGIVDAPPVGTANSLQEKPVDYSQLDDKAARAKLEQDLARFMS